MDGAIAVGAARRLTASPPSHWSRYPSVICDRDGDFCAAWYRYPPPASGLPCAIYFCRGAAGLDAVGEREPVRVVDDARNHTGPVLCQDGAGAYWLAWHCWPQRKGERFLLLARSADGARWSEPRRVLAQVDEYMIYPSLAWRPSGSFWMAFAAGLESASRILLVSSADGESWSEPVTPSCCGNGDSKASLAIGAQGELLLAWRFRRGSGHGLRVSSSRDGADWEAPQEIATGLASVERPKLAVDRQGVQWLSFEGEAAIWLCRRVPGGAWSSPRLVARSDRVESRPSALVQGRDGSYWIAWTSERDGTELWGARVRVSGAK